MLRAGLGWCAVAMAAMAWGQAKPAAPRYASLLGVVLDDATEAPVARAVVTLQTKSSEPFEAVAWTDNRGAFSFSRVPLGPYFLFARRDGYETARFGTVRSEQPPEVLLLASAEDRRVTLRMRPLGSISGTVTDPDGDPITGVNVTVFAPGYNRRKPQYWPRNSVQTDRRGHYRVSGLSPGKYVLIANAQWQRPAAPSEVVRGQAAAEESRYAPLFYPNADRIAAATPIVLAPGKNLEGFDFQVSPQPVGKLTGKVILPADPGPNPQILVQVRQDDALPGFAQGVGVNPADGAFQLNDLLPGRYLVAATFSAEGRQYRGVEHVEVGHDAAQVTLHLDPGVELAGSVRLEGDPGGERPHFRVTLVPGDGIPMFTPQPQAEVKPDGSFRIPNVLAGVWDINVEPVPKGGYIKSMRLGDQDVLTEEMLISPSTAAPLNIVVSTRGAVVDGTVTEPGGDRAKKSYVLLAPAGAREKVWTFYQVVPVDEDGHFELKGVTPGAYALYALARMDSDPSQDPDFLRSLTGRGAPIQVAEGSHVTRDLQLIPEEAK